MDYLDCGDLAPSKLVAKLTTEFYPGNIKIERGDGWVYLRLELPIEKGLTKVIELVCSRSETEDETYYCLGLFCDQDTWAHIHLNYKDVPKYDIIKIKFPTQGEVIR